MVVNLMFGISSDCINIRCTIDMENGIYVLLPPLQGFPAVDVLHSFQVNLAFDVNGKLEIKLEEMGAFNHMRS